MFLLRSMFWLTVAYVAMQPRAELENTATALSGKAVEAGQQMIIDQVAGATCHSLQCEGGKALLSTALSAIPSSDSTMQEPTSTVPIPRPRPHWMG